MVTSFGYLYKIIPRHSSYHFPIRDIAAIFRFDADPVMLLAALVDKRRAQVVSIGDDNTESRVGRPPGKVGSVILKSEYQGQKNCWLMHF